MKKNSIKNSLLLGKKEKKKKKLPKFITTNYNMKGA
jgi:hypothetical protein